MTALDAIHFRGAQAQEDGAPDLLIEIPHGATRTIDFTQLQAKLTSPLPEKLVDFFHVNTDAGAPELAEEIARRFVQREPARTALVLRCRIPRTFIDCNRNIDAAPEDFKAGKVTPGLMPWITTTEDRALLRGLYEAYVGAVADAAKRLAANGGAMLLLHTYAPRSLDVTVDEKIVESLHRAYSPEIEPTWPMRPPIDVICRAADGTNYAPAAVLETLQRELAPTPLAISATYPLHPSTLAWAHVMALPGRALCVEVRRDLLADPFVPFAEQKIDVEKVARLAAPLTAAICRWW